MLSLVVMGVLPRRLLVATLFFLACSGRSVSHSPGSGTISGAGAGGALAAGNGSVGGTSTAGGAGGASGASGSALLGGRGGSTPTAGGSVGGKRATGGTGGGVTAGDGPVAGRRADGGEGGADAGEGGTGGLGGGAGTLGLQPNQCATEQSCANAPPNGCYLCFPRGERACGGPAPRPADCASDTECQLTADNLICETAPCENAHCIAGCLTAEDCEPSHVCTAHRCEPRACDSDAECSGNFVCTTGACARRACTRSSDCEGFCVEGSCHEYAGSCQDACLP